MREHGIVYCPLMPAHRSEPIEGEDMTTQSEMGKANRLWAEIELAATTLDSGEVYSRYAWRDKWTTPTMHALGFRLRELFDEAKCAEWTVTTWQSSASESALPWAERHARIEVHPQHGGAVLVVLPGGATREYGSPWCDQGDVILDLASLAMYPEVYTQCHDCGAVLFADDLDSTAANAAPSSTPALTARP